MTIYNTSLLLINTNNLAFVSIKSVKIYSIYREEKFRAKRISKIFANGGPIGLIYGTRGFLVKHYQRTEFHSNRSRTRHSCHTKHISYDQSFAMVTIYNTILFLADRRGAAGRCSTAVRGVPGSNRGSGMDVVFVRCWFLYPSLFLVTAVWNRHGLWKSLLPNEF